jgi:hypothetical protein
MEAKLGGNLTEKGVPDGLARGVAAGGYRLHVVEDQHPRHKAQGTEAVDEATEQRLLAHVGGPPQPDPPAVLEPATQDVARRRLLLREAQVPDLAPVDLQVLARQPPEPHRDIRLAPLQLCPDPPDPITEGGAPAGEGVLLVAPGQLAHAHDRQALSEPLLDLLSVAIDHRGPLPSSRPAVHWLSQDPSHGHPADAQLPSDRPLTLAALCQETNGAAFHLP